MLNKTLTLKSGSKKVKSHCQTWATGFNMTLIRTITNELASQISIMFSMD